MKVAVVGATGMVGQVMLKILEERNFPVTELIPVATERSIGKKVMFKGKPYTVVSMIDAIASKPNLALFSAGGNTSLEWSPKFAAVGTTVMRAIESSVSTQGEMKPFDGWTNKFIFPPYEFSVANCMVTNFHMPESTLLMMVAGFGGYDHIMHAYKVAVKEKYRFYSYGDAMLII